MRTVFRFSAVLVASSRIVRWMFLPHPLASGNFVGGYAGVSAPGANATTQASSSHEAKMRFMVCLAKCRDAGVFRAATSRIFGMSGLLKAGGD